MRPGGSFLTLTYYGAEKVTQNYNVMGIAKAALESSVRLSCQRSGDRKTFGSMPFRQDPFAHSPPQASAASKPCTAEFKNLAPLRRNVTIDDVGNSALYLCSDLANGVTGEVQYVDAGFNIMGAAMPESKG